MLGKLKEFFGPGQSGGAKRRRARVNLQRRFAIVSETARGSMSHVYRAIDNQTGRTVCLKVQKPEKNRAAASRTSTEEPRPLEGEIAIQLCTLMSSARSSTEIPSRTNITSSWNTSMA
jgi:serine/threonine-protein kinase